MNKVLVTLFLTLLLFNPVSLMASSIDQLEQQFKVLKAQQGKPETISNRKQVEATLQKMLVEIKGLSRGNSKDTERLMALKQKLDKLSSSK